MQHARGGEDVFGFAGGVHLGDAEVLGDEIRVVAQLARLVQLGRLHRALQPEAGRRQRQHQQQRKQTGYAVPFHRLRLIANARRWRVRARLGRAG